MNSGNYLKLLIKTNGGSHMAEFSMDLANYIKEKIDVDILFMSNDENDWEYYTKLGINNVKDVKDYLQRIKLKSLSLDLYEKFKIDKDKLLMNNFVRYKRLKAKTIDHFMIQENYNFKERIAKFIYPEKKNFYRFRTINKLFLYLSRLILFPLIKFPNKKTYDIKIFFHKFIYLITKFYLLCFRFYPETIWLVKCRKIFENINLIALINKKKGFGILAKVALQYFLGYYLILKELKPDMVLIYNGNWTLNTTLTAACEKLDISHYYTETSSLIGYSHFDSTAVWFDGDINSLKLPEWDEEKEKKLEKWINEYFSKWKRGIASVAESDEEIITRIPKKKFIFIPLQIMDDTNSIKFSPLLKNNLQLVQLVLRNQVEGYDIVIKRHPWDNVFADDLYKRCLEKIKGKIRTYNNVHLYHYADSQHLLRHCSALVTANSTLSIENLLAAKVPMVIVGDNCVRNWGFTYDINNLKEYPIKLKKALTEGLTFDMEKKMKQFLYEYIFKSLVKGHYPLNFQIRDKKGNVINQIKKRGIFKYIGDRIVKELLELKTRKKKGLNRLLPGPLIFKCMIDRSRIFNYKGVQLDLIIK